MGCGAGRHSIYLQNLGYDVLAVDKSPIALKVSKLRGVRKCKLASACNLPFSKSEFNTILMMCNNFGICGDFESTMRMLRKLHKITKNKVLRTKVGLLHLVETQQKRKSKPIGLVKIRIGYKGKFGDWFELLMITPHEMEQIADKTGWNVEKIISHSEGYIAILKKNSLKYI